MRRLLLAATAISAVAMLSFHADDARSQGATVQIRPDGPIPVPADLNYPDAVTCNAASPQGVVYRMVFYKSQTVSFATEVNNAADYGTIPIQAAEQNNASAFKWRLQLGKPGNITVFTLPPQWTTDNCSPGKTITQLFADKQAFKIFVPE